MKKRKLVLVFLVLCLVVFVYYIYSYQTSFNRLKIQRESIVEMVANGELTVQSNGCIVLPNHLKKLSASGECFVVEFFDKTGIYFYTFRGILDSSRGYVYITDKISYKDYYDLGVYSPDHYLVNIGEVSKNWYSCVTD